MLSFLKVFNIKLHMKQTGWLQYTEKDCEKSLHLAQITSSTTLHFIPMTLGQGSFFQYGFHIISL